MSWKRFLAVGVFLVSALLFAATNTERYTANIIVPATLPTIKSETSIMRTPTIPQDSNPTAHVIQLDVVIEGYTSDQEMDELGAVLSDGSNQDALLGKINSMKGLGWVATQSKARYEIKVVRSRKTPKGREITMLTNRPLSFSDVFSSAARTYRYGMLRFTVSDKGEGDGKIDMLVRVKKMSPEGIVVDNYGAIPWDVPRVQSMK